MPSKLLSAFKSNTALIIGGFLAKYEEPLSATGRGLSNLGIIVAKEIVPKDAGSLIDAFGRQALQKTIDIPKKKILNAPENSFFGTVRTGYFRHRKTPQKKPSP